MFCRIKAFLADLKSSAKNEDMAVRYTANAIIATIAIALCLIIAASAVWVFPFVIRSLVPFCDTIAIIALIAAVCMVFALIACVVQTIKETL